MSWTRWSLTVLAALMWVALAMFAGAGYAAGTAPLADAGQFAALLAPLRATPWVVYAKPRFGGPAQVLKYLGRYTHRIAITNARLVSLVDGVVQFRWKDYADRGHTTIMALAVDEFLRRFLLHVLPRGFVRIRPFGLLANRQRRNCRQIRLYHNLWFGLGQHYFVRLRHIEVR